MSELESRLTRLRNKLKTETDPDDRADLEAAIAAIEAQYTSSHNQSIAGQAQISAAIAGDVRGNVVTPLFPAGASGNYIAGIINIYQGQPQTTPDEYDAALRRYLIDIYNQHATFDLRGIDERQVEPPLRELYIALTLSRPHGDDLLQGIRHYYKKVTRFVARRSEPDESSDAPQTLGWQEVFQHYRRVAVVGPPGSGKTTLLHYTAVRLAEALARDEQQTLAELGLESPLVPLLLPLRELGLFLRTRTDRERIGGAQPRHIIECLNDYYAGRDLQLPTDFFSRLCEDGRALLLLDGLDEVTTTDDRNLVAGMIDAFAVRYPHCRLIVTARIQAYIAESQLRRDFAICTVNPLAREQQQRFIANWSRCVYRLIRTDATPEFIEREAERFDTELWVAVERSEAVAEIITNPLLLTIVAIVFYNRRDLPENRAALYDACITVLLRGGRGKLDPAGKLREQYSGLEGVRMPPDEKRELLAAIAYRMHCGGESSKLVSHDWLVGAAKEHLDRSYSEAESAKRAQAFIAELPVHLGLLDELEQRRYGFTHLTFQEFLAARYVADHDELWDVLASHFRETWWREVILLCAGYLPQERCWRFLERLIAHGELGQPVGRSAALALAADALAELERFKGQGRVRDQVREQAVALLQAPLGAIPATGRVACGRALAIVGDPRPGVSKLPPAMVRIAGGSFMIGNTPDEYKRIIQDERANKLADEAKRWFSDTVNEQPIKVADFEFARYPVTNAQYELFIKAGGYDPAQLWWDDAGQTWLKRDDAQIDGLKPWQRREYKHQPEYWENSRFGTARPNHPVVGVSWYEASAFCRWLTQVLHDGFVYRLPSEAEWEYAARGSERRQYPWGNQLPDGERANFDRQYDGTTAVGCFPAGATPHGVFDMAGNVWEWTSTVYASYPYHPADGHEDSNNPANKYFTLRGGGWVNQSINLRASFRYDFTPADLNFYVGFRVARHPLQV